MSTQEPKVMCTVAPPADMMAATRASFDAEFPNDPDLARQHVDVLLKETGGAAPTSAQLVAAIERHRASLQAA